MNLKMAVLLTYHDEWDGTYVSTWMGVGEGNTYLPEPVVQSGKLLVSEHRVRGGVSNRDVRTISPGVHHEESDICITEIVVIGICFRIVIGVRVVELEGITSILERGLRIITLSGIVVDNLG